MLNHTAAIRDYIAANPGARAGAIAAALAFSPKMVSNACRKMAGRGLTVAVKVDCKRLEYAFYPGRAVLIDRTERARMAHKAKAAARRPASQQPTVKPRWLVQDTVTPKAAPYRAPAQSVDEYIANGGHVEVLPGCRYIPATVMPTGNGLAWAA